MGNFFQDIRYGFRMLLKSPGFTAAAVVALALGIGANTAIFSVVNSVLLRPFPYEDPDRLVIVWETNPMANGETMLRNEASPANWLDWKRETTAFEEFGAFNWNTYNLTGTDAPEHIVGNPTSAGIFAALKVKPLHGRVILPEDDQEGAPRVVVLSHGLWQRRFGGDPSVVGQQITLNNNSHTVVGVMPQGFEFPSAFSHLWTPLALTQRAQARRGAHYLYTRARLKPGVSIGQAQAELSAIAARLEQQYPDTNAQRGIRVVSLNEDSVETTKPLLLLMLAAVGFVLLIACANVANLMLARAASRQREIAIRTALGASRWRVMRQLLTESVLLSLAGGTGGLLLAMWGVDILKAGAPEPMTNFVYGWNQIGLDARVLLFTLGVSVVTGIVFGLAPALQASKPDMNESLKEGERGSTGGRNRLRSALVVTEVALSLVLLVGAGLMIRSFLRLLDVHPGFDATNVVTMHMQVPSSRYRNATEVSDFYARLVGRLREQPGVESAAVVNLLPMSGSGATTSFIVEGRPAPPTGQEPEVNYRTSAPGYFGAMRIPVARGRDFTPDDRADTTRVAVVNETFARQFFPDEDPVGRRLLDPPQPNATPLPPMEIVGVVGDVKHWGLDDKPTPFLYVPHTQAGDNFMTLVVRAEGDPASVIPTVRREVLALDKDQPVFDIKTMEDRIADMSAQKRMLTYLLGVMAAVALVLAGIGIYGVIAYTVARRTHEIGIRMALGAQRGDIMRLVLRQGMLMTIIGVAVGLGGAYLATRLLDKMLYGVTATDPATFVAVSLVLASVALLACLIPARRAMKVDPMVALRYE
ncbi:MAG TPA: ABC transporter permease [Pyrinomonadaceae bacterium]|nr:ABC transporter permease [Pyrinomonadaceae bacterium]